MKDDDTLIYIGIGPTAAIVLGIALIPLRGLTVVSNFTLAFLALTIAIGELGGRTAAVATAIVSAFSLDFFLTPPYMHLTTHGQDDFIAIVSLILFGLLAATLASSRRERAATLRQRGVVQAAATRGVERGSVEPRLQQVTDAGLGTFPVTAVAVRDAGNRLLARSGTRENGDVVPALIDSPDHFVSTDGPLPAEGLRLPVVVAGRHLGWFAMWGDGRPAARDTRHALAALAVVSGMLIDVHARPREGDGIPWPGGS